MYLKFLWFSTKVILPENSNLRLDMEEWRSKDWLRDNFTYGINTQYSTIDHLDIFVQCLKALN